MLLEQMKELIVAVILGALQGFTEFLPVSSTVHLGIASQFLSSGKDLGIYATNLISLGTTIALIQYFWYDIVTFVKNWRYLNQWLELALATAPIVIASLLLSNRISSDFRTLLFFGIFLIVGACLLAFAEWYHKRKATDSTHLTWLDYIIIGAFQALAVFPGMSRSGSTLAGGLFLAKERGTVIRASFWLSVPAFLLASVYSVYELLKSKNPPQLINTVASVDNLSWVSIGVGAVFAYIVGIYSLRWLIPFLSKQSSTIFIVYRTLLGVLLIIYSLFSF